MTIRHSEGSYEIVPISFNGVFAALPADIRIITDQNVADLCGIPVADSVPVRVLAPGESSKSLETFSECLSWLAQTGASRKTTVVAVGGGVIGDLAGFVASAYMRGVPFIQVPTTLLAQVDSSVGGKVGVDLPEGKNLAGAFYPPVAVYLPLDVLQTLPDRQLKSGTAEVLKYGFIMDAELLDLLKGQGTLRGSSALTDIVRRCIALKAQVVEEDEREETGFRAILNFGHTVGHAIEKITGYGPILHGEAISIGMVVEARLGERLGITERGSEEVVAETLQRFGLPTTDPIVESAESLVAAMRSDKKAHEGKLAFSLLTRVGECKLVSDVPVSEVFAALRTP